MSEELINVLKFRCEREIPAEYLGVICLYNPTEAPWVPIPKESFGASTCAFVDKNKVHSTAMPIGFITTV